MSQSYSHRAPRAVILACAASLLALPAVAAGTHGRGHAGAALHGQPGKASQASRMIEIVMHDNYFEPESVRVQAGETIRFEVRNAGDLVHEFNIGTASMHAGHREEMTMMVEHGVLMPDHLDREAARHMEKTMGHGMHNEPNSVLLEPGKSGEVVWRFPRQAEVSLEFGCNVPGHYESGMAGQFEIGGGS
ncbi:MAG TPA: cupredoxin domain-containing protein [Alphaproteobacteria bacterium]|nr:cupredoxin domain-containing protein [Alphaproteobacteria bacterium]